MSDGLIRVGLGGLIASGKSTLAAALVVSPELHLAIGGTVEHVDADVLLRTARASDGQLRSDICAAVPEARSPDGSLDTGILASLAFADPIVMALLERLQWPVVHQLIAEESRSAQVRGVRLLLVEAIALGRSGLAEALHGVLFLEAEEEIRRQRFIARGGAEDDFRRRNAAQVGVTAEMRRVGAFSIAGAVPLRESVRAASVLLSRLCLQGDFTDREPG